VALTVFEPEQSSPVEPAGQSHSNPEKTFPFQIGTHVAPCFHKHAFGQQFGSTAAQHVLPPQLSAVVHGLQELDVADIGQYPEDFGTGGLQ